MSCARSSSLKIFNWSQELYRKVLFNAISDVLLFYRSFILGIKRYRIKYCWVIILVSDEVLKAVLYAGIGSNLLSSAGQHV